MGKKRRIKGMTLGNLALFAMAGLLLLYSSIGSARAALTFFSETYTSRVQMLNIGVSLLENGTRIAWRDYSDKADGVWDENKKPVEQRLLQNLVPEGETFQMGKAYTEELSVQNSGTIDQYVRVNIYRYWVKVAEDGTEEKLRELSPDLIDLHLVNTDHWVEDKSSATEERMVLYYDSILPAGETSPLFCDTLTVSGVAAGHVTQTKTVREDGYTVITTRYDYNGVEFRLEVEVNAVQTHNAQDAIWSSWGREVAISPSGTLSLI